MWVPTYLTLHRFTGEAGQRDRQSRLSSTQSRSRIEVGADHSLPNLPYLPVPTLPSTLEHQVGPVQSTSLSHHHHHHPMLPVRESTTSQVQYLAHPIPFSSHPTPAQPTCVHNNPCEIRLGRLGRQHLARSFRCVGTSTSTCTCTKGTTNYLPYLTCMYIST